MISELGSLKIADLFFKFEDKFLETYPQNLENLKAIRLIQACRTEQMGGHLQKCGNCDYSKPMYNSCRSRMCPTCQSLKREQWVEKKKQEVLPCKYYHAVFTLPHSINKLTNTSNKQLIYSLLFEAVSETLMEFGENNLGGQLGFICVLHTWNQLLLEHNHLHCLIPAGVIHSKNKNWVPCKNSDFLFPVKAVSIVFRGKFLEKLKKKQGSLKFIGKSESLKNPRLFQDFIDSAFQEKFVVYIKQPFDGAKQVINYLGRYVHKTGISNHRLVSTEGDNVTFKYRDRKDGNKEKLETLPGVEFLRRFMIHNVPRGFQRIRNYGFLANRSKKEKIAKILQDLDLIQDFTPRAAITAAEFLLKCFGVDIQRCPKCKEGKLYRAEEIQKSYRRRENPRTSSFKFEQETFYEPSPIPRARSPSL